MTFCERNMLLAITTESQLKWPLRSSVNFKRGSNSGRESSPKGQRIIEPSEDDFSRFQPHPSFRRSINDQYLWTPKPFWYLSCIDQCPTLERFQLASTNASATKSQVDDASSVLACVPADDVFWCFNLIESSPMLEKLNLSRCSISSSILASLALILKENSTIVFVDISDNPISAEALKRFLLTIQLYNFTISRVKFSLDFMEDQDEHSNVSTLSELYSISDSIQARNISISSILDGTCDHLKLTGIDPPFMLTDSLMSVRAKFGLSISQLILGPANASFFRLTSPLQHVKQNRPKWNFAPYTIPPLVASKQQALFQRLGHRLKSLLVTQLFPTTPSEFTFLPPDANERILTHDYEAFSSFFGALPFLNEIRFEECCWKSTSMMFKEKDRTFFTIMPFQLTQPVALRSLAIVGCGMKDVDDANLAQGLATGKLCWQGAFFAKLPHLEFLDLSNNELARLPETIGLCTSLTSLSFTNNKIEHLPESILMLTKLKQLHARPQGKQTLPLPGDIDKRIVATQRKAEKAAADFGLQSRFIQDYLTSFVEKTKTIRPNRFKLVFVGDGAVGKTTTIRSLQQLASSNATNGAVESNILDNVATDGVDIKLLRVPVKLRKTKDREESTETLVFSCWDFAGQDIYTYSHSFFMTEKSIYLIGFDCSQGESSQSIERLDYWLQAIRGRFPEAHCIIFGTHTDALDKEQLRRYQEAICTRYNISKDKDGNVVRPKRPTTSLTSKDLFRVNNIHFLSNTTGRGVEDLLSDLKMAPTLYEKMQVRMEVPLNWLRLEERGKAIGSIRLVPVISWKEWKDLAENEYNLTEAELKEATRYLHETGSISWFQDEQMRNIVYLRPSFLTDVFAAIISAKLGISTTGFLQHEALPTIWKGLPEELFPHLLRILEKFEMIHKLDDAFMAATPQIRTRSTGLIARKRNRACGGSVDLPHFSSAMSFSSDNLSTLSDSLPSSASSSTAASPTASPAYSHETLSPMDSPHSPTSSDVAPLSSSSNIDVPISPPTNTVLHGYSVIPALLPDKEPPAELLDVTWSALTPGAVEYKRIYTFQFIPNGFFTRLLIRVLQSKWDPMLFWREGIIVKKGLARMSLRYSPPKRSITLIVRGPDGVGRMGSLIDSISALIEDWLPNTRVIITIPLEVAPGVTIPIELSELATAVQAGEFVYTIPSYPLLPPIRIDSIAPDVTMFTNSTKIFGSNEIQLHNEIGRGGFAVVHRGTTSSGTTVACKRLTAFTHVDEDEDSQQTMLEAFTEFRREVWLMSNFQHPNIVSLIGVIPSPNLTMVLEYMNGGNLFDYLHGSKKHGWEQPPASLSNDQKFALALGIAEGMKSMHSVSPPIVHRDLKTPNILLTFPNGDFLKQTPIPKIADFGLSRGLVWDPSISAKAVDNPMWLAPEVINRKPYNEKVDVYAFGIILFEIVTGELIFPQYVFYSEREKVIAAGNRPPIASHTDPILAKLIDQCWAQEPSSRPSFEQIVSALRSRTVISSPAPSRIDVGSGWESFDTAKAIPTNPPAWGVVNPSAASSNQASRTTWRSSVIPQ